MIKSALCVPALAALMLLAPSLASAETPPALPAFMLDTTCPNAIAPETRLYDLWKTDALRPDARDLDLLKSGPRSTDPDVVLRYMAEIAPVLVPAMSEVALAFDACAAGYSQPDQTRQAYHARIRASQARLVIGVLLLSERKMVEGRASLEAANVAVTEAVQAPSSDVTPEDQSFAGSLARAIAPMLEYVAKSGDAFDPRLMFPARPAPVPY